jgi:hypothetical protein
VLANRTGTQILHKTYAVDSGAYGTPSGPDYTSVLMRVRQAIIKDQIAAGDGNLRATILLHRGRRYDYTNNSWAAGIQYLTVQPDPRDDPRAGRPKLRNIRARFVWDSELAILVTGAGSLFAHAAEQLKAYSPTIYTTAVGDDTVRLKRDSDARYLRVGRWFMVGSYDQQLGGYPPNIRYVDYVRVTSISGATVKLDRRLRHIHRDNFFETPSNPFSMGVARLIPLDVGGSAGILPAIDSRLTIRENFRQIEFLANPSNINGSTWIYITSALDASFEDCIMPHPVPSNAEHVRYLGGSIGNSEPDKLISTLIYDRVTTGETGGATGVEFLLMRNVRSAPMQISPRQLRTVGTSIDGTNDTYLVYPITWAYNGPILSAELLSTGLQINPTYSDTRVMPAGFDSASLTIGTDARWDGDRLIISSSSPHFLDWEVCLFEGAIVYVDRTFARWGVVRRLGSPGDGSAIWADVQWMAGLKPSGGTLRMNRAHSITIDDSSRLEGNSWWGPTSGQFVRQRLPASFGSYSRNFPTAYPAADYGF